MSDIAERLMKAIQAEEAGADSAARSKYVRHRPGGTYNERRPRNEERYQAILRRCAADRELVDLYRDLADQAQYYENDPDPQLRVAAKARFEVIEKVLRNRARGYGLEVEA